jgi:hypothetical protein
MEPLNDNELCDLLRQWEAPEAPAYLEQRIFNEPRKQPWYGWLLNGSIRVPVPVLVLVVVVLAALTFLPRRTWQAPAGFTGEVTLSDFQPVAELKPRIIRRAYETN